MSKILVAYFSASGETARLAKTLAGVIGGDLFAAANRAQNVRFVAARDRLQFYAERTVRRAFALGAARFFSRKFDDHFAARAETPDFRFRVLL